MMAAIIRQIGDRGKAYDAPGTKRAYTYADQPGNSGAWKLGMALNALRGDPSGEGDPIDAGLKLLQHLQQAGFRVFEIGAEGHGHG